MKNIKELYKDIILDSYYDEAYGGNGTIVDGIYRGVCIDFSKRLLNDLIENGYKATIISTSKQKEDGSVELHAAVLYRDRDSDEVLIADPVTDLRYMSQHEMNTDMKRESLEINDINCRRSLTDYINEFGNINVYNNEMNKCEQGLGTEDEVVKAFFSMLGEKLGQLTEKKMENCTTLTSLSQVKDYADGPTWLACETLYKKGIHTYCSTFSPVEEKTMDDGSIEKTYNYICINGYFDSLSESNKKIFLEAMKRNPDNYFLQEYTGFYGTLGSEYEIKEGRPIEFMIGFKELPKTATESELINKTNELAVIFEKQISLEGVYTREQVLNDEHNRRKPRSSRGNLNSTPNNDNVEMANNECLQYSSRFDLFFKNEEVKSRYIESIYSDELENRSENEIATFNGVVYSEKYKMFFENAEELSQFERGKESEYEVTTKDIVEVSQKFGIGHKIIQKIKELIDKMRGVER